MSAALSLSTNPSTFGITGLCSSRGCFHVGLQSNWRCVPFIPISVQEHYRLNVDAIVSTLRKCKDARLAAIVHTLQMSWPLEDPFCRKSTGAVGMGALAKARHATAFEKIPAATDVLESAIAWSLLIIFGKRAVALHGASTQVERAETRFQAVESVRLFCGSIRAAGVGITLTAASHVIFLQFDWSPERIVQQAEDRCHRVGQKSSVLVQCICFSMELLMNTSLRSLYQSTVCYSNGGP